MYSKIKNLVEYYGIADELPILDNPSCFKQFCLHDNLMLPETKPDMLQIIKVVSQISILNTRVIRTPKATSLEGQRLTGFKLLIDGTINQKVEYVGSTPTQEIYAVHFNIPFCTYIILPENFKTASSLNVTGYIEDITADVCDRRSLFQNAILLLIADL